MLGSMPLGRLDVEALDSFYAELRRCREHCDGRAFVEHRTSRAHVCDEHRGDRCRPANPQGCR
ncbi:MAG: site-specific integrase, partial [Nocardioidaceae bacterium]